MKIMAVDLGLARTGLAVSDMTGTLAAPLCTLNQRDRARLLEEIAAYAASEQVSEIIVGLPKNMDGSCGESAQRAEDFARALKDATGLEVVLWDERLTTVRAHQILSETNVRGKKRKAVVDTVSAVLILQSYLDSDR